MEYNILSEITAFIIISILVVSIKWDKELCSESDKYFRYIFYGIFYSSIFIILTAIVSGVVPINEHQRRLIELVYTVYYILLPIGVFLTYIYAVELCHPNSWKQRKFFKNWKFLHLPYVFYVIFVILNYFTHTVFTVSSETGYERGTFYKLPYLVAGIYAIIIIVVSLCNRRIANRKIPYILCINVFITFCISMVQFFFPHLLLVGTAHSCGVLVMYFFVQNNKKSSDRLTLLYRRDVLRYHIDKMISAGKPFTLAIFSIRDFKSVNQMYGLSYGDELLILIADYFRQTFPGEYVYRYSGDEFAVIIKNPDGKTKERLSKAALRFESPFVVDNCGEYETSTTVDVMYARVDYPKFGHNAEDLISAADYSISVLKKRKTHLTFVHDNTMLEKINRKNAIVERLKEAIENDGFEIYYQAIYSSDDGNFPQAEALIRMKYNTICPIYPSEFIPIAEEIGLITKITYIVLEKVCEDLSKLNNEGFAETFKSVSVNFPYAQFFQKNLISNIMEILNKYNVEPSKIKIEITERALIADPEVITYTIKKMQKLGFVFELDDFGVDYSNISMILDLPIDIIKVDRSLILAVVGSEENKEFFEYLIKGINCTGKMIITEGVEDEEVYNYLTECGCKLIQGYYFTKPLPYDQFVDFLTVKEEV